VVGLCGFICGMPMCSGYVYVRGTRADAQIQTCVCSRVCVCGSNVRVCVCDTRVCVLHACLSREKEGNEGNRLLWPSPASPSPVALATAPRRPRHCPKRPSPATMVREADRCCNASLRTQPSTHARMPTTPAPAFACHEQTAHTRTECLRAPPVSPARNTRPRACRALCLATQSTHASSCRFDTRLAHPQRVRLAARGGLIPSRSRQTPTRQPTPQLTAQNVPLGTPA
jgi:hypothetical protein